MRYRLTIITLIATALVAAVVVFGVSSNDDPVAERRSTEVFSGELGLVAAFTATAQAGGAIDPTAFATPTSTSVPATTTPTSSAEDSSVSNPSYTFSNDAPAAGESTMVEISGAVEGETFEVRISGQRSQASNATADADGNVTVLFTVPESASGDSFEIEISGSVSGTYATTLELHATVPSIEVNPGKPEDGESITVAAEGFASGEAVKVEIAGKFVGSGIAGTDGSFSMTTGLPQFDEGQTGPQELVAEGSAGSAASTTLDVPRQQSQTAAVTGSGEPGAPADPAAGIGDSSPELASANGVPGWVYVLVGGMAGWMLILTVWVYRLDRDREAQFKFMRGVITDLSSNATDGFVPSNPGDRSDRAA